MTSYNDVMAATLEKLRPAIIKAVEEKNAFCFAFKEFNKHSLPKVTQTAATQTWFKNDGAEEPEMRKFHFIGGESSKYWQIWEPMDVGGEHQFAVKVEYGRIGKNAQQHTKEFWNQISALHYYEKIIKSKLNKGYVEQQKPTKKTAQAKKAQAIIDQVIIDDDFSHLDAVEAASKTPCEHVLKRKGKKWICQRCGDSVELETKVSMPPLEVEAKAKRFINLNWRKE